MTSRKAKNIRLFLLTLIMTFGINGLANAAACTIPGFQTNAGFTALCDLYILFTGRIFRATVYISVSISAWNFSQGGMKWQEIATFICGIIMIITPKGIALIILPSTVTGVTGSGLDPSLKYTPEQILNCECSALR